MRLIKSNNLSPEWLTISTVDRSSVAAPVAVTAPGRPRSDGSEVTSTAISEERGAEDRQTEELEEAEPAGLPLADLDFSFFFFVICGGGD